MPPANQPTFADPKSFLKAFTSSWNPGILTASAVRRSGAAAAAEDMPAAALLLWRTAQTRQRLNMALWNTRDHVRTPQDIKKGQQPWTGSLSVHFLDNLLLSLLPLYGNSSTVNTDYKYESGRYK